MEYVSPARIQLCTKSTSFLTRVCNEVDLVILACKDEARSDCLFFFIMPSALNFCLLDLTL